MNYYYLCSRKSNKVMEQKLHLVEYTLKEDGTPRSYLIYGDTKQYADKIKTLPAIFRNHLSNAPEGVKAGWILSACYYDGAVKLCADPDNYEPAQKQMRKKRERRISAMAAYVESLTPQGRRDLTAVLREYYKAHKDE